ncbi:MAG: DNA alkylation repair protein [Elusimicrobiota bacterium]
MKQSKQVFTLEQVMKLLKSNAQPDQIAAMARFGLTGENRLGVSMPNLRKLGKSVGKNHGLALKLWDTGIPDAMILAALIENPAEVTESQADRWVNCFAAWDVCDQVCSTVFDKVSFAEKKVYEWSRREEEFVKRAAYSLIAYIACHDKKSTDEKFIQYFGIIKSGSEDNRNYVKKAVSWALRQIGKRNLRLNKLAIDCAKEIQKTECKGPRWVASDVLRELTNEKILARMKNK